MKYVYRFLPFLLVFAGFSQGAWAQPIPGTCEPGIATGTLDANDVSATAYTTGSLFWGPGGDGQDYIVPVESGISPIYASNLWIGGIVNNELRISAETYGQAGRFELWPGPLNEDGSLPNPDDCSAWDRIWNVSRADIEAYEETGNTTADLAEWPYDLGAPVIDGDGNPDNYDLEGGDRPEIIGDQALWWILNDVGNDHLTTESDPIGMEVRVQAFAFSTDDALDQATFYKFTLAYKGEMPLDSTHFTLFSDPDLGSAGDDLIGSDTTRSMGYVFNAGDTDSQYGVPPALGYTFLQGPLVSAPGESWEDPDGTIYTDATRLGMTTFTFFNSDAAGQGNPVTADEYWNYMQSLWRDGSPLEACGGGYQCGGEITTFAFYGDPSQPYSEPDNWYETPANGADKRFMVSTGPFTMQPGDEQEIIVGIVFGKGEDRLDSITELRAASDRARAVQSGNFPTPAAATAPPLCDDANPDRQPGSGQCFGATALDTALVLSWGYAPDGDGFLGDYVDEFVYETEAGNSDTLFSHAFEGFNLYEYGSPLFDPDDRRLIATFDKANGITEVFNGVFDPVSGVYVPEQTAWGEDSGLDYALRVDSSFRHPGPLRNYTDYYYGLTTYTVDRGRVTPPADGVNWRRVGEAVVESAPTFITVKPSDIRNADGGTTLQGEYGEMIMPDSSASSFLGDGTAYATVVDASKITGDTYAVEFYHPEEEGSEAMDVTTYDIVNATTGEVLFSGQEFFNRSGKAAPNVENAMVFDGLSFTILGIEPTLHSIVEVVGPGGVDPCGPDAGSTAGCPVPGNNVRQSFNGTEQYVGFFRTAGSESTAPNYAPNDFEIRWGTFDEDFSYGYYGFSTGNLIKVPFTIWDIGLVPPGTENDPSDDVQMVPVLFPDGVVECMFGFVGGPTIFGFGETTQRIYAYYPVDDDYAGYEAIAAPLVEADPNGCPTDPTTGPAADLIDFERNGGGTNARPLQREVIEDGTGGTQSIEDLAGSIMRFYTSDPFQPGARFVFNTVTYAPSKGEGLTEAGIDRIGIVPNPYTLYSTYETAPDERVARFTNLPERATIRIYTIAGSRVRTLEKDDASRSVDWDLRNGAGREVGSGLYLIHIELPESGHEKVLKFGIVNREEVSEL